MLRPLRRHASNSTIVLGAQNPGGYINNLHRMRRSASRRDSGILAKVVLTNAV